MKGESRKEQKHEWLKANYPREIVPKLWSRGTGAGETGWLLVEENPIRAHSHSDISKSELNKKNKNSEEKTQLEPKLA